MQAMYKDRQTQKMKYCSFHTLCNSVQGLLQCQLKIVIQAVLFAASACLFIALSICSHLLPHLD